MKKFLSLLLLLPLLALGGNHYNILDNTSATISGGTINGTTIGNTTPAAGNFTTLGASGAITPTYPAGIVANPGGSVTAGSMGENYPSNVTSSNLTSSAQTNVGSVMVTAGNWLVMGYMNFIPAASTVTTNMFGGFSTTSTSLTNYISFSPSGAGATGVQYGFALPTTYYSLSSGGTIYCITEMIFTVSTATAQCVMQVLRMP